MKKNNNKAIITYLIVVIAVFLILNIITSSFPDTSSSDEEVIPEQKPEKIEYVPALTVSGNETTIEMKLPAVDTNKTGVVTSLKVTSKPGTGKTLVDIDSVLFWADTQQSIRVARQVASLFADVDISRFDLIYSIKAPASLIGGPSAGAALTIATIAALEGKRPSSNVMITGAINHDGTIGPVSEILEKAKAAKNSGAAIFLVPALQSEEVQYETTEYCETYGHAELCTQETRPKKVDVGAEAGIEVIEVSSIEDAMKYFFS